MSEIERLTSRVTEFSAKTDFWNNGVLLFLVMTALAAVGIVICQQLAFVRARQMATAQSELASAKESEANTKAEGLRLDIAKANERAAEANELAEKERLARVKIEAKVAWRHLNDKQKADIAKRLHNLHPPEAITVWFFAGDAESARFAFDTAEMLREGKMYVYPPQPLAPPVRETC